MQKSLETSVRTEATLILWCRMQGTRFLNASTNSPICVSARACLATGQHVYQNKCWDNAIAYDGSIPSWGHYLQRAGITATSIGKLHYRFENDPTGLDEQFLPMHIADGIGDLMGSIRPDLPERTQSRKYSELVGPGETEYTAYDRNIAEKACNWFKDRSRKIDNGNPFVLFVSFIAFNKNDSISFIISREFLALSSLI